jgi:hypothetical protein
MHHAVVVDGDGHVMEPEDLWLRYLELQWRDRAIRIARDAQGIENLLIDGRGHRLVRGKLGTLGAIGMQDDLEALFTPGARSYQDGLVPGGYDPAAGTRERVSKRRRNARGNPRMSVTSSPLPRR